MNKLVHDSVQVGPAAKPQGVNIRHRIRLQLRAVVNSGVTAGVINAKVIGDIL